MSVQEPSEVVLEAARELAARHAGVGLERVRLVRTLSTTWLAIAAEVVVKVHPAGASGIDLTRRLALAALPALRACVVPPLVPAPVMLTDGPVWATVWPRADPLPADIHVAPWASAGRLLARLHRLPTPDRATAPTQGSVRRLHDALRRLAAEVERRPVSPALEPAVAAVRCAAERLPQASWNPAGGPGRPRTLVHGDWHLGQLARPPGGGADGWRLIDVDDLGLGDPVWDLGRPAAFWAAGLMPDRDWRAFLDGYREGDGPAIPAAADPWPDLDDVARACVVLAAAGAVRRAIEGGRGPEGADERLIEVCGRLAHAPLT